MKCKKGHVEIAFEDGASCPACDYYDALSGKDRRIQELVQRVHDVDDEAQAREAGRVAQLLAERDQARREASSARATADQLAVELNHAHLREHELAEALRETNGILEQAVRAHRQASAGEPATAPPN